MSIDISDWVNPGHHSDTNTLTVELGEGQFTWLEVSATDSQGNMKTLFSEGEMVYLRMRWRNDGTAKSAPVVTVTDINTDVELKRVGFSDPEPGEEGGDSMQLGVMPNHDWHLRLDITP